MRSLISLLVLLLFACRDVELSPDSPPDVYVSGAMGNKPVYWKNGVAVELESETEWSSANAIEVVNSDVFVVIQETYSTGKWLKNDVSNPLEGNGFPLYPSSIAISGNDVYVGGAIYVTNTYTKAKATIWKNGKAVSLTEGSDVAIIYSIAISDGDVYGAGWENYSAPVATYWKNGVAHTLASAESKYSIASAVFVDHGDVYVSGYERADSANFVAKYWKNGNAVNLTNGSNSANASDIFISGNDIYVSGAENFENARLPVYWINGERIVLPKPNSSPAETYKIRVHNNDVYVLGVSGEEQRPLLWKNNVLVAPFDGTTITNSDPLLATGAYDLFVDGN